MRAFLHARSKEFGILLHLGMAETTITKDLFLLRRCLLELLRLGQGQF